jgi:hypothetical protein
MEINMSQAAAAANDSESSRAQRPVATFKQGGVEVSVWKNHTDKGDLYNTTIRNTFKDEKNGGEWKETTSFSSTDLAVVSQLASQAFQEITVLKSQARGR